jgi:nucleoside 2-deoxyribosyltransferase
METQYTIYFAGDLFDHKHLIGNKLLASAIFKQSNSVYKSILPQEHEQSDFRATAIRNQDIYLLAKCDLALFNFDGTDLDSGTVVEFMVAKMLNIPSVILRSDFRAAGDQLKDNDPWNLMVSGYPSTQVLLLNAMQVYQSMVSKDSSLEKILANTYIYYAEAIIRKLNSVLTDSAFWSETKSLTLYHHLNTMMGSNFKLTSEEISGIISSKKQKGLITDGI